MVTFQTIVHELVVNYCWWSKCWCWLKRLIFFFPSCKSNSLKKLQKFAYNADSKKSLIHYEFCNKKFVDKKCEDHFSFLQKKRPKMEWKWIIQWNGPGQHETLNLISKLCWWKWMNLKFYPGFFFLLVKCKASFFAHKQLCQ